MARVSDAGKKGLLMSPKRQLDLDVHHVMSLIPILPYHTVADIGCGPGDFTVPLGKHLFDGKVYAIDAQQEMLDATKQELERVRLTNVELVLSKGRKLPLEDDSLDGALAAFELHGAGKPEALLKDALRCLRKGGWFALLEWHRREMEEGPPLERRIDEAQLREMAENVGLRFTRRHSLNDSQYMLLMSK